MGLKSVTVAAILLLAGAPTTNAHSWVEFLYRISATGAFTGDAGYPIGYVPRDSGVSDDVHQNKILDTSTNPPICKPLSSSDIATYPPLRAAPGDYIAMQYQENGHVTQPDLTPRPYRSGNVYVYGTLEHQDSDGINDVLNAWTIDGKGGNQKGKLLATHYFDDNQCFQNAPGIPLSTERQQKFGVNELFCQTDLQLPSDLPTKGTYTLMWVWDWPLIVTDTQNVTEIYTTCAQIDLEDPSSPDLAGAATSVAVAANNNIQSAAISSQLRYLVEATTLGVGTSSPPAVTGLPDSTSQPAPVQPITATSPVQTSDAPATTTSSAQTIEDDGIKTVTVTAEPHTVTQIQTVVVSGGGDQPSAVMPTEQPSVTMPASSFPTSFVPVTSVHGFLKARGARVTGQARREYRRFN
ncbi:hypothetical protein GGS21DRAFT_443827 [Xylaria nigripes]|nr:hypothetical protein GGS21DRAFT_443827 [Xylaria nigripes]